MMAETKKRLLVLAALICLFPAFAAAQDTPTISGTVRDSKTSDPLVGAVVRVKNSNYYAVVELDGTYTIRLPKGTKNVVLDVTLVGYKSDSFAATAGKNLDVTLIEDAQMLNESQVIAYGTQSKMSVTGAMSSVNTKDLLRSPAGSTGAALAGAVTGISSVQISGQPGAEDPDIFVRGTGSLTESASKPLILVDGVERSFFQMDANEIDNITVLKDAASTAVFGVRGANGVILVTTRRGEEGKTRLSVDSSFGITQPLRNLDGVDSYTYATRYNWAQLTDDPYASKKFSSYVLDRFRLNDEPVLFPSVNWEDYIFKDIAWQTHHNVNVSGGDKNVRYFVSLGFLHEDGMVKRFYETYNPNFRYNRFNYRANIDANLTKTTKLSFGLGGRLGARSEPQNWNLWEYMMWCVPYSSPGFVDGIHVNNDANGYITAAGSQDGLQLYYNWGYITQNDNVFNFDMAIDQDLSFITKGLSAKIKGAYNSSYTVKMQHDVVGGDSGATAMYLGSITTPGLNFDDPNFDRTIVLQTENIKGLSERMGYSESTWHSRDWYLEASVGYNRTFGDHAVTGLFLYNQNKTYYPGQFSDIPTAYLGYVWRATYQYKTRYLFDINAGYNGSENFAPGRRFGFFPSGSVGWIISEEPWMKKQNTVDFLKIRASWGLVGNDKYSGTRFMFLQGNWAKDHSSHGWGWKTNTVPGAYEFGDGTSQSKVTEAHEGATGNESVSWEKCFKQNYGLDLKMLNYRLNLTVDYFFEHRWDILSTRNTLPGISSIELPLINLGIVDNQGIEFALNWNDKIAGVVKYDLTLNFSYSKNKIKFMDEVIPNEPYMAQTGLCTGLNYGYEFSRFLTRDDFDADGNLIISKENGVPNPGDIVLRPGDAMYKDLNGDGIIDSDDCTYFGHSYRPDYTLGFIMGFNYKRWGLNMQFTGAIGASRMFQGGYRNPFGDTNGRQLLKYFSDYSWREEIADQARFPRLTFSNKSWNQRNSTLWLMDGSYLRLKTIELSYTFGKDDAPFLKKAGMSGLKIYFNAYNPWTVVSELAKYDIDPEGSTGDINWQYNYPNVRVFNFGVNINF